MGDSLIGIDGRIGRQGTEVFEQYEARGPRTELGLRA
jgi:hypothetical protein